MAKRTLVNFYIECEDQTKLESVLYEAGFAFYDATQYDDYCADGSSLEDVESELDRK
jgi:hypothetical protein